MVLRHRGRLGTIRLDRMALMVVLMIAQGFLNQGTDNAAHIGGFLAGLVLGALLYHPGGKKSGTEEAGEIPIDLYEEL